MENHAFVEHFVGSALPKQPASTQTIENRLTRVCRDLSATVSGQLCYRNSVEGILLFVAASIASSSFELEIVPTRQLTAHQDGEYREGTVSVAAGEPFWLNKHYTELCIRVRFTGEYLEPTVTRARDFVSNLANALSEELWPVDYKSDSEVARRLG